MIYDGTVYEEIADNIISKWVFWTNIAICGFWAFILLKTVILSRIKFNKGEEKVIRVYKLIPAAMLPLVCISWYFLSKAAVYCYLAMNDKKIIVFVFLILQFFILLFFCCLIIIIMFSYIVYITNKRVGRFNFLPAFMRPKENSTGIITKHLARLLRPKEILFKDAECKEDRSSIIYIFVYIYKKRNKFNSTTIVVPFWKVKKIKELVRKEQENNLGI